MASNPMPFGYNPGGGGITTGKPAPMTDPNTSVVGGGSTCPTCGQPTKLGGGMPTAPGLPGGPGGGTMPPPRPPTPPGPVTRQMPGPSAPPVNRGPAGGIMPPRVPTPPGPISRGPGGRVLNAPSAPAPQKQGGDIFGSPYRTFGG